MPFDSSGGTPEHWQHLYLCAKCWLRGLCSDWLLVVQMQPPLMLGNPKPVSIPGTSRPASASSPPTVLPTPSLSSHSNPLRPKSLERCHPLFSVGGRDPGVVRNGSLARLPFSLNRLLLSPTFSQLMKHHPSL